MQQAAYGQQHGRVCPGCFARGDGVIRVAAPYGIHRRGVRIRRACALSHIVAWAGAARAWQRGCREAGVEEQAGEARQQTRRDHLVRRLEGRACQKALAEGQEALDQVWRSQRRALAALAWLGAVRVRQ